MREKLVEVLETVVSPNELLCYGGVLVTTSRVADHLIVNDVVPVVRCKDCYNCTKSKWCNLLMMDVKDEWFCSHGERKDNDI